MKTYEQFIDEVVTDEYKRINPVSMNIHKNAANKYAKEMVLAYARWYEQNSAPAENQNDDWMIRQNVDSFFAGI